MGFIFSTSSYAFALGLDRTTIQSLAELYAKQGIRLEVFAELPELVSALERTRYLIAIHVPQGADINLRLGLRRWGFAVVETPPQSKVEIDSVLEGLLPEGLDEWVDHALRRLTPIFFDKLPIVFSKCTPNVHFECDVAVQCDTSAWPHVGRSLLLFNQLKYQKLAGASYFDRQSHRNLVDMLREFVNQFLGILNQSLVKQGFNCRIGLPLVFTKNDVESFLKNGLYMPSVHLCDEFGIFDLRFGMINSTAGPKLDLRGLELVETSGEIDFL